MPAGRRRDGHGTLGRGQWAQRGHPGVGARARPGPGDCPVNVPFVALGAGARRPVRVVRRRPGRRRGLRRRALTQTGWGCWLFSGWPWREPRAG